MKNGFALGLTLLLMLILAILGFSLLLIAGSYYSSSHNLFESQNARLTCEAATQQVIDLYNQDPGIVNFPAFTLNGYNISIQLKAPWNSLAGNVATVEARRGSFVAKQQLVLKQRRLEDFALYTDSVQNVAGSSLFDGLVFCGTMQIGSSARFRDFVQCEVIPEWNASFRKKTIQNFPYANVDSYPTDIPGISVLNHNALFWKADHYELDVDQLTIQTSGKLFQISYRNQIVGTVPVASIRFDDIVYTQQTDSEVPYLPSGNAITPLYVSAPQFVITTNIPGIQDHPLCLISNGIIRVSGDVPAGCRIHAMLIARGSVPVDGTDASVIVEPGSASGSFPLSEMSHSVFIVEPEKQAEFSQAVTTGEKVIWFRGSVIAQSGIIAAADVSQMHFEASRELYSMLPSLPFIYVVEGSKTWL